MPTITVTPNPAAPGTLVDVRGSGFARARTRLVREDGGIVSDLGRPSRDGSFSIGLMVGLAPTRWIAQQRPDRVWQSVAVVEVKLATTGGGGTYTPPAEPPPDPTPPAEPANVLEVMDPADGESAWTYKHASAGVPIGVEAAPDGVQSFRVEVRDGHTAVDGTERSEWANGPNPSSKYRAGEGDTTWTAFSVYLKSDFPTPSSWLVLHQWKVPREGTPPLQVGIRSGAFAISTLGSNRISLDLGPMVKGQRVYFLIGTKWHSDPAQGWFEAWRGTSLGTLTQYVAQRTYQTLEQADDEVFWSAGIYRALTNTGTAVAWVGKVAVGSTKEAAIAEAAA